MFQFHHLLPDFTALETSCRRCSSGGAAAGEAVERARRSLEEVVSLPRADHAPAELSGGEQQRWPWRALVNDRPAGGAGRRAVRQSGSVDAGAALHALREPAPAARCHVHHRHARSALARAAGRVPRAARRSRLMPVEAKRDLTIGSLPVLGAFAVNWRPLRAPSRDDPLHRASRRRGAEATRVRGVRSGAGLWSGGSVRGAGAAESRGSARSTWGWSPKLFGVVSIEAALTGEAAPPRPRRSPLPRVRPDRDGVPSAVALRLPRAATRRSRRLDPLLSAASRGGGAPRTCPAREHRRSEAEPGELRRELDDAIREQDYERAARLRESDSARDRRPSSKHEASGEGEAP